MIDPDLKAHLRMWLDDARREGYRQGAAEERRVSAGTAATAYESGRRRGRAECPCGTDPRADDLLDYHDGLHAGFRIGRRQGERHGSVRALVVVAVLGLVAVGLGRER